MIDVAVVDYGVGNLLSVSRALAHCGARVSVTADPARILAAARVVLPGVGAFANGMAALQANGLDAVVKQVANNATPLLGICLGMQMLFSESAEFGATAGLGLIPGRVVPIPAQTQAGKCQKTPHIGWNELLPPAGSNAWQEELMAGVSPGDAVYFVHSFMAVPDSAEYRLADCLYGGLPIAAVVKRGNVIGCQFHPEKSGEIGLAILRRFVAHSRST